MAVTQSAFDTQVTDLQLSQYGELIYKVTGIRISPQKKALLSNRLRRRFRKLDIDNYDDYLALLKKLPVRDPEWAAFLQEITTHETFLFRDTKQWEWFQNSFLKEHEKNATGPQGKTLRIWSAACSTGDEAHTIGSCIVNTYPNLSQWDVKIVGTDIGIRAVEQAKLSAFGVRAMNHVPDSINKKCFNKAKDADLWIAKPNVKKMLEFKCHNLLHEYKTSPFHVVFLKNVLIYFDRESKRAVLKNVCKNIRPGGYLVAGAAEGVADLLKDFQRHDPWLFQKTK